MCYLGYAIVDDVDVNWRLHQVTTGNVMAEQFDNYDRQDWKTTGSIRTLVTLKRPWKRSFALLLYLLGIAQISHKLSEQHFKATTGTLQLQTFSKHGKMERVGFSQLPRRKIINFVCCYFVYACFILLFFVWLWFCVLFFFLLCSFMATKINCLSLDDWLHVQHFSVTEAFSRGRRLKMHENIQTKR